jgi:hypothetical protein
MNSPLPQNGFVPATEALLDERVKRLIEECPDRRIDAAIERKPDPPIPADFAAQVAFRLAARAATLPQRRRSSAFPIGRSIAWASTALLAFALFVLAPHATPNLSSFRFDAEILALLELAGLGWGLARGFGVRSSS